MVGAGRKVGVAEMWRIIKLVKMKREKKQDGVECPVGDVVRWHCKKE